MHTWFSPDCDVSPQDLVDRCIKVGLACIAVTDQNTIEGALAVQSIAPFPVIIGEEVASSEGEITGLFLSLCSRHKNTQELISINIYSYMTTFFTITVSYLV